MRGFRFSLRWLFGVVSLLAVGCGLLVYASPLLSKLTFTAAATTLLVGLFSAVDRTGDQRAFSAGFAAFGFAYLWMVCGTWRSPDGLTFARERLVTTDLLTRCYEALPSSQASAVPVVGANFVMQGAPVQSYTTDLGSDGLVDIAIAVNAAATSGVDRTDFLTTGHSLFAILFALLGGAIARRCSSRQSWSGART